MKRLLYLIIPLFFLAGCTLTQINAPTNNTLKTRATFAVIGDNEGLNDTYTSFISRMAKDDSIQFIVHTGDLTDDGGESNFKATLDQMKNAGYTKPFYVAPGNHDITPESSRELFEASFGKIPFSVDTGSVHLVILDNSERKIGFTDETLTWLEQDLKKAGDKTIILVYHRPFGYPFANLLGDDETKASRVTNEKFKTLIAPYHVATIFAGHVHTYFQYPFLIGSGDTAQSIPLYVTGGGGDPEESALSTLFHEKYHYLKVTVEDGQVQVEKISLVD